MVYTKAYAEVVSINNTDVMTAVSGVDGTRSISSLSVEEIKALTDVNSDLGALVVKGVDSFFTTPARRLLQSWGIDIDATTIDELNEVVDTIHDTCPTSAFRNFSAEIEDGDFDNEETDW